MNSIKQLMCAGLICVVGSVACVVHAVDTAVPAQWDVTPWTNGSKLEQFSVLPSWASTEALVDGSARPDSRFWAATAPEKVLSFATLGITNTFSGAKIQIGAPIFIDMRCKLNPFDTTPPTMESNTILCFYANQNSNLVVASATECKTNATITISPSTYYPIMIRFAVDKFDIFFNNDTTPALFLNATTNEISKMVLSGAGEMDDLYVSFGNPWRSTTNSGVALGWTPDSTEEYAIANWLANKTTSGNYTLANAEKFYLTDTDPNGNNTFEGELGVGSFSYDPSTSSVTVVVTLKTDASTKKTGKINGKLKLKGAADYTAAKSGSWSGVLATTTIQSQDFANGIATYKFALPNADYKFFLPVIESDIK